MHHTMAKTNTFEQNRFRLNLIEVNKEKISSISISLMRVRVCRKKLYIATTTGHCKKKWSVDFNGQSQKLQFVDQIYYFLTKFSLERILSWVTSHAKI